MFPRNFLVPTGTSEMSARAVRSCIASSTTCISEATSSGFSEMARAEGGASSGTTDADETGASAASAAPCLIRARYSETNISSSRTIFTPKPALAASSAASSGSKVIVNSPVSGSMKANLTSPGFARTFKSATFWAAVSISPVATWPGLSMTSLAASSSGVMTMSGLGSVPALKSHCLTLKGSFPPFHMPFRPSANRVSKIGTGMTLIGDAKPKAADRPKPCSSVILARSWTIMLKLAGSFTSP